MRPFLMLNFAKKAMAKIGINIATGSLQQNEIIVGIDLGTTNSLVAIIHPESKHPVVLREHNSRSLVPSIIHFDDKGVATVGDAAKEFLHTDPSNTIFSAKRLMGKTYADIRQGVNNYSYTIIDDEEGLVKVRVGDKFYSPVDLSSMILKELKHTAEHLLKTPVNKAVITVPAYFNDTQRQATRDAGRMAGLDVLRIINEPTAASLAYGYGLSKEEHKTIAVYDLGGGTFDISILTIADGIFEVLSTNGDTFLGGDDLDAAIADHWISFYGFDQTGDKAKHGRLLRLKAEEAKIWLTDHDIFETVYESQQLKIDAKQFEAIITPIINNTIACCVAAIKDAKIDIAVIDEVIMVGGSTRTPLVKKLVGQFFGRKVNDSIDPDEVVALGAALQADILAGNTKEFLLLDITPLSLGLETMGGLMEVLLPRNTRIPAKASRQYTTYKDGQSGLKIAVYQGERDLVKDNRLLAEFILKGIPGMPAGMPKIEISFLINADGILVVHAKELRSGVEQVVEIKPQYGLTDGQVEKMLMDSMQHAQEDVRNRAYVEARTEAEQLLLTTEKFIQQNYSSLSTVEIMDTSLAMQALQLSMDMPDKDLIRLKIEELNNLSRPYAERIMDEAVGKAMAGKKI